MVFMSKLKKEISMRFYKCLTQSQYSDGEYSLVSIRDEDKYEILKWRNAQIDILRQQKPLTNEIQENYFKTVVASLFEKEQPDQILWSFLQSGKLIGYGGLVHINWQYRTAEVSFLTETSRNTSKEQYISDWFNYLTILKKIVEQELNFISIYTYAYDLRPNLYVALEKAGFSETKRDKNAIEINGELKDVVIHTYNCSGLKMHSATIQDVDLYFEWANDEIVRKNSYQQEKVVYENHVNWFNNKLNSKDCYFYLFTDTNNTPVGQVRIDKSNNEVIIGISIDKSFRGQRLGDKMLIQSCNDYLKIHPKEEIVAYIKVENQSSYNIFKKAGFQLQGEVEISNTKSYKLSKIL